MHTLIIVYSYHATFSYCNNKNPIFSAIIISTLAERERGKEKNIDKKNDISIGDIPGGPAPAAAVKVEEIKKADRIIYANLHTLQGPQKSELISVESKIVDVVVVITSQTVLTLKKRDKFI